MGVQEEGFEVLSCEVCVQGGYCIVSGKVAKGRVFRFCHVKCVSRAAVV